MDSTPALQMIDEDDRAEAFLRALVGTISNQRVYDCRATALDNGHATDAQPPESLAPVRRW